MIAQTTVMCKKQLQWACILELLITAYNTAVIISFLLSAAEEDAGDAE